METTASHAQVDPRATEPTEDARGDGRIDLARAVMRAPSIEAAFVLVRAVYPLGMSPPPDVREALFTRTANDHVLAKVLLFGAQRDEDLVQDVLAWWWEFGLDTYDPAQSAVRTYLHQVAFHRLMNGHRKSKRRGRHHAQATDDLVAQVSDRLCRAADLDAVVLLAESLDGVPPNEATAWLLAALGGCSNAEIASVTGIPLGSVSRVVERVRARLEGRYASRNPALLALVPAAMLQRPGPMERAGDLLGLARASVRGAIATAAGKVVSYALVAGLSAGVAVTVAPRREVRVFVRPTASAPAVALAAAPPEVSSPVPASAPVVSPPTPSVAVERSRGSSQRARGEEASELEHAMAAVATRPPTALSLVAAHRRRWPRSALAITRDAVEAEALLRTGEPARAREIAARVVARDPASPEAFRMRQLGLLEPTP